MAKGMDAVIVDSVLAVRKGLTESPTPRPSPLAAAQDPSKTPQSAIDLSVLS